MDGAPDALKSLVNNLWVGGNAGAASRARRWGTPNPGNRSRAITFDGVAHAADVFLHLHELLS